MRTYVASLPAPESDAVAALLARADLCCERLEPALPSLLEADAVIAQRFPWHSATEDEGAAQRSKKQRANDGESEPAAKAAAAQPLGGPSND